MEYNSVYILLKNIDNNFDNIIQKLTNFDNNFDNLFTIFDDIEKSMIIDNYDCDISKIIEICGIQSKKLDNIIDLLMDTEYDNKNDRRFNNFINKYNDFEKKINVFKFI